MMSNSEGGAAATTFATESDPMAGRVHSRIMWRIVPFLFICYVVSFIDRINIGFAKLGMQHTLSISEVAYGLAASSFFVGYLIFEVPSNLLLARIGARRTMTRIMLLWGLAAAATGLVRNEHELIAVRFLLGVFEAGFYPGMILYLTFWFPSYERARVLAALITATAVAGVVGGPLSAFIMYAMDSYAGLHGWQWMFILQGLSACLLGVAAYLYLDDRPNDARWLTAAERACAERRVAEEGAPASPHGVSLFKEALRPKVFALAFCCFSVMCGAYALSFWIPTIIRAAGIDSVIQVGLYSAIPYVAGVLSMILVSRHSDLKRERRWHFASCTVIGGFALLMLPAVGHSLALSLAVLSIAVGAIFCASPIFWTMPTSFLSKRAAPAGLALINSVAITGGIVGPYLVGWSWSMTGGLGFAMSVVAVLLFAGALTALVCISPRDLAPRR